MGELLRREEFRESVFSRDQGKCVICGDTAVDAHHIVERRLWKDGGYYLDNGVSLCAKDHLRAEATDISCEELREKAGIQNVILPEHLESSEKYDKWGNIILDDGTRSPGELFGDESVQKILSPSLPLFRPYVKHPRTMHLPWSPGASPDDTTLESDSIFAGQLVVVTEKLDGENTNMYRDHIHARSIDSKSHPTRDWVKALWGRIRFEIPPSWRFCGENMYAKHSLGYDNLKSYFYLFSVWNEKNQCLSWDETKEWADLLGLEVVPVLYEGMYDRKTIEKLWSPDSGREGYVVRTRAAFSYREYRSHVAKFVRPHHVTTSEHWMNQAIVPNRLLKETRGKSEL